MLKEYRYAVVGGDTRFCYLIKYMQDNGHNVKCFGLEKSEVVCCALNTILEESEVLILPLTTSNDGIYVNMPLSEKGATLEYIADNFKGKYIFCAKAEKSFLDKCRQKGIKSFDYYDREDLTILNAIPSAEGALGIALSETAHTVHGSTCLVTGFGRISKVLSKYLLNLGAQVYITARKAEDFAGITTLGAVGVKYNELTKIAPQTDIVFNTVPSIILNQTNLDHFSSDTLFIDLASKPGGIDLKYAAQKGLKVIWALGLPGKTAPKTSGEMVIKTIFNILIEEETQ